MRALEEKVMRPIIFPLAPDCDSMHHIYMQRVTTGYGTARKDARAEGRGYFTRDGRRYALVARGGVLVEADLGPVEPVTLDSFFAATDPDGEEVAA